MAPVQASMWSRMTGRAAAKTLPADLKRITHSSILDIPQELLTPVIDASNNEEDRPEIMKHIRECLAEPSGKQWRRIYGALVLVEALVKNGSPALMSETAEGRHFDLVQRLSFLEHFDNTDKRVTSNIRKKAEEIRKVVIPSIENAALGDMEDSKDTESTGAESTITQTTAASSSMGQDKAPAAASSSLAYSSENLPTFEAADTSKRMVLNNIVSVGHNDDTTSESEGDNTKARAPVRCKEPRRMTAKARNERSSRGDSSDSDDGAKEVSHKTVTQSMDLLGL